MYYVAKTYLHGTPNIVESFETLKLAQSFADIMTAAGKGNYIVLQPI